MAKQSAVQFERELNKLFDARTVWLRGAIQKLNPGRPPSFTRKKVKKTIERLQDYASDCVVHKFAKREFESVVDKKKQWHAKGRGRAERKRNFILWFKQHIPYSNCVYVFWEGKRCRYVGRTVNGAGRPQGHFDKAWCTRVTRVDIYSTSSASEVPKLECLGIHWFRPTENGPVASRQKWAKKCPVCRVHKQIRKEISSIFRLRS